VKSFQKICLSSELLNRFLFRCDWSFSIVLLPRQTWDEEVTLPGDPPEAKGEGTTSKSGKYWNPQDGGCEGMSKIADAAEAVGSGVPVEEAYVTLEFYKRYRKSFPLEADFKPVN
jgi:hypothetical protein